MPFTTKDVSKHKKGLTSSQKKKWVEVANSILSDCIEEGGTDKTCAPKAIRIANSKFSYEGKFMKEEVKQIPKKACGFITDNDSKIQFQLQEGEEDVFEFEVIGYSGGVIANHWYWNNLIIDLEGMSFPKDKYPVLMGHDRDKRMGYTTPPLIDERGMVMSDKDITFLDNEDANEFIKDAKAGFPFEASIYAEPTKIEYISEDTVVTVNGKEMQGPGHVWRESIFKEQSIAVFGYDSNTSVNVFEDGEEKGMIDATFLSASDKPNNNKENVHMDYKQFAQNHPDEAKRFEERILEDAEKKFDAERKDFEKKLEEKDASIKEFEAKVSEADEKIKEFEKRELKAQEKANKEFANKIWDEKLKEANMPESLHSKIKAFVSVENHKTEDGVDEKSFSEAVDKELEGWKEFALNETEPSIQGSGSVTKTKSEEFSDKEADELALKLATKGNLTLKKSE
jgi:uncharacterized protein YdaT